MPKKKNNKKFRPSMQHSKDQQNQKQQVAVIAEPSLRSLFKMPSVGVSIALVILSAISFGWGLPMIIPSNPHNGIILFISGLILSGIIFLHSYEVWKQKNYGNKWIVVLCFGFVIMMLLIFNIQYSNASTLISQLRLNTSKTSISSDNIIRVDIKNYGQVTAYQFSAKIIFAPTDNLSDTTFCKILDSANAILPDEDITHNFIIQGAYLEYKGKPTSKESWAIYYQLQYSDAETGGRFYKYNIWFNAGLGSRKWLDDMTIEEKRMFEPYVIKSLDKGE
jgi:hypothetical protein